MKLTFFKYKYVFIASGVFLLLFAASCKKYVTIKTPVNAVGTDEAFSDSSTATSVILGLYSSLTSQTQTGQTANTVGFLATVLGAMSADEGYYLTSTTFDEVRTNTLSASSSGSTGTLWSGLYYRIARANYAIDGVNASTGLSVSVKDQLLGEAKFIRAWNYFYLVNFFGAVPLVTSTDALNTALLPRTDVAEVYKQIIQDLTDAKSLLTTNYPSPERARINKNVASAFLARVYFYQQNWSAAESEATNVITSGAYSLVNDLNNVFLNNSNETIWQISLAGTSTPQTIFGSQFIPSGSTPTFVLYDTLAKTFEDNDQRKLAWTKPITYIDKLYYYPNKYKVKSTTAGTEYPVMIRLAEMYLIRAEARANQDNIEEAVEDINLVRLRAGLTDGLPDTISKTDLLNALEHERWVELFTEWSDRWFNLKRKDRATAVLSLIKPAWESFQQLYPIPQSSANPNLTNNLGYE